MGSRSGRKLLYTLGDPLRFIGKGPVQNLRLKVGSYRETDGTVVVRTSVSRYKIRSKVVTIHRRYKLEI